VLQETLMGRQLFFESGKKKAEGKYKKKLQIKN
jgi:hypothetical protein